MEINAMLPEITSGQNAMQCNGPKTEPCGTQLTFVCDMKLSEKRLKTD